jgi:hypothetical protein
MRPEPHGHKPEAGKRFRFLFSRGGNPRHLNLERACLYEIAEAYPSEMTPRRMNNNTARNMIGEFNRSKIFTTTFFIDLHSPSPSNSSFGLPIPVTAFFPVSWKILGSNPGPATKFLLRNFLCGSITV